MLVSLALGSILRTHCTITEVSSIGRISKIITIRLLSQLETNEIEN